MVLGREGRHGRHGKCFGILYVEFAYWFLVGNTGIDYIRVYIGTIFLYSILLEEAKSVGFEVVSRTPKTGCQ